jgi:hypothetical protein
MTPQFVLAIVSALLCLAAGNVGAEEELIWPLKPDLVYQDSTRTATSSTSGTMPVTW